MKYYLNHTFVDQFVIEHQNHTDLLYIGHWTHHDTEMFFYNVGGRTSIVRAVCMPSIKLKSQFNNSRIAIIFAIYFVFLDQELLFD